MSGHKDVSVVLKCLETTSSIIMALLSLNRYFTVPF